MEKQWHRATTMFVRFRHTRSSLQVSLAETQRDGARVRQTHVAALGSVDLPLSASGRIAFWTKLHQRLGGLGNRIDAAGQGAILADIHERIPMPTPADQQAVLVENARADANLWASLSDLHAASAADAKGLLATVNRQISEHEAAAAEASTKARIAAERLARTERGEDAGGIGRPLSRKEIMKSHGWAEGDVRHAHRLDEIEKLGAHDALMVEIDRRRRPVEKAASRAVLKRARKG